MHDEGISPNARRLLWAGFFAILAAAVGFGIRANIGGLWRADFGFTDQTIGDIATAAFPGFCFGIIAGGLVCDRLGYRLLVLAAFVLHLLSAFTSFLASKDDPAGAEKVLYWSTFVFGLANGTLEAVANPLVATLFPTRRTHYLNILHASWPLGLVLGGLLVMVVGDAMSWKAMLALFLVPTLFYGVLFFGQEMPRSEARRSGLGFAVMFRDVGLLGAAVICLLLSQFFHSGLGLDTNVANGIAGALLVAVGIATKFSPGSFLLFVLFVTHLLVGAVELGTDSWISSITGNFLSPSDGHLLFVFTSAIMFALRFCAGAIERLGLSPIALLLVSALLAFVGLQLSSGIETFAGALIALTVYAVGKTFFWPTMLAVASDRFPRTGAIAISLMGGIGMLSAGVVGGPGLGYAKDRFVGEELRARDAAIYAKFEASKSSQFLVFAEAKGIDGKMRSEVEAKLAGHRKSLPNEGIEDPKIAFDRMSHEERAVIEASIAADRRTLQVDSFIPAGMAGIYLLLLVWFKSRGGYRVLRIGSDGNVVEG